MKTRTIYLLPRQTLPKASGIYCITLGDDRYVGGTVNLKARKSQHVALLRWERYGASGRLQEAFDRNKGRLRFKVLLLCDPKDLEFFERRAVEVLKPTLNERPVRYSQSYLNRYQGGK